MTRMLNGRKVKGFVVVKKLQDFILYLMVLLVWELRRLVTGKRHCFILFIGPV